MKALNLSETSTRSLRKSMQSGEPVLRGGGFYLFSDQCMLTYRRGHDDRVRCFFDSISEAMVTIDDYDAAYADTLQQLVDRQLVSEREETGALSPTPRSIYQKAVWDNILRQAFRTRRGCIPRLHVQRRLFSQLTGAQEQIRPRAFTDRRP